MKKFVLLTRPGCITCDGVRSYLRDKGTFFEEWNVEDEKVEQRLINDPKFSMRFCDIEACYSSLPAIRLSDTGDYYFGEDLLNFKRYYALDRLLELD